MNILDKIVEKTKTRTETLDLNKIKTDAKNFPYSSNFAFKKALLKDNGEIKIIAEIKKASPSKGLISQDFNYLEIAKEYNAAQVDAISVLTEPYFFLGKNSYIEDIKKNINTPILRKDFIIDEVQIYESKLLKADCILLICAILDEQKLKKYIEIAQTLGISTLVEAHTKEEIKKALSANAEIIGVNNRNLKNFEVDFNNTFALRKLVPPEVIFVSESGIKTRQDIMRLQDAGVNAVLIGETLMRAENKIREIKKLRGVFSED